MKAVIDIGSNSLKLLIGYFDLSKKFILKRSAVRITALGENLDQTENFSVRAQEDTMSALTEFKEILTKEKIDPKTAIIVGTEACRVAKNGKLFLDKIEELLGFKVDILSSRGEAYYSSLGCSLDTHYTINNNYNVIMDLGGASTEIIKLFNNDSNNKKFNFLGLPIGAVRSQELFNEGLLEKYLEKIYSENKDRLKEYQTNTLLCLGGIMTSLGNIFLNEKEIFDEEKVSNVKLTLMEFEQLFYSLKKLNTDVLKAQYPFLGKRAPYLISGLNLSLFWSHKLEVNEIIISCFGLRHGLLYEGRISDEYLIK